MCAADARSVCDSYVLVIVLSRLDRGIKSATEVSPSLENGEIVLHIVLTVHLRMAGNVIVSVYDALVLTMVSSTLLCQNHVQKLSYRKQDAFGII